MWILLLVIVISWSEISNKSFRLMAFRYQNPGKLAPFVYVYSLYGLSYDLFIFHVSFNIVTWSGIFLVGAGFGFHVYKMLEEEAMKKKQHEQDIEDDKVSAKLSSKKR